MKKLKILGLLAFALNINWADAAEVKISCGAVGIENDICRQGAEAWAKKTNNKVTLISTPNSATERLALYQQLLSAKSTDLDVLMIDVIWPSVLATHLIDLKPYTKGVENQHFKSIIENNTVNGQLVAMPWFTDAGLIYYRKDLLEKYKKEVPKTIEELTNTARFIQNEERKNGNNQMQGYIWQGQAYEGLTAVVVEWLDSFEAGNIVDSSGKITIDNPNSVLALKKAVSWIGDVSPKGVLSYTEEESRGVFQSGNAVFLRNWPYVWALVQSDNSKIKDKVGVMPVPPSKENGKSTGALGGWQLSVSKYSKNRDAAADLVLYLTSYQEQKRRAIVGSFNPTIADLYKDEEVIGAAPFFKSLYNTFINAVPRPSTATKTLYPRVSNIVFTNVNEALSGQKSAEDAIKDIKSQLDRLSRRGWK